MRAHALSAGTPRRVSRSLVSSSWRCCRRAFSASLAAASAAAQAAARSKLIGGVPVGVQDTPAGALAAADNYLALASQSIEQDPAVFAALVAQATPPQARGRTLAEAQRCAPATRRT